MHLLHAVGIVSLAGVSVACGGGGDDAATAGQADGLPVIESAAGPPGTPLPDGFEVADGTTLIGDAVPIGVSHHYNGEPVHDEGWTATLLAEGTPGDVVQAYLDQAEELGLVEVPVPETSTDEAITIGGIRTRCAEAYDVYTCRAMARSPEPARSLEVLLFRGAAGAQFMSHAFLRYSTSELQWNAENTSVVGDADTPVPELPDQWPALPGEGEPFAADWPVLNELVVEPGSRVTAPAFVTDCATGGSFAVLEVTGDPDEVLAAYAGQVTTFVGEPAQVSEPTRLGDAVIQTATGAEAGGYHYTLTLVQREGRPAWITADGCND